MPRWLEDPDTEKWALMAASCLLVGLSGEQHADLFTKYTVRRDLGRIMLLGSLQVVKMLGQDIDCVINVLKSTWSAPLELQLTTALSLALGAEMGADDESVRAGGYKAFHTGVDRIRELGASTTL